ncbi:MAG: hypothetical protein GX053_13430 [Tissierella sp.]|nr:hypothetical protein [Tissierella sp.]
MGLLLITKIKTKFYNKFMKNKYDDPPAFDEIEKLTIEEVRNARTRFDEADENSVDLAIYELMAAEERLSLLIQERKKKQ